MADSPALDPLYVAARRVLLDALTLLAPHGDAVIVVGAQAVYLRTGELREGSRRLTNRGRRWGWGRRLGAVRC